MTRRQLHWAVCHPEKWCRIAMMCYGVVDLLLLLWLVCVCHMTHSHMCDMTYSYTCDVTHSYICDTFHATVHSDAMILLLWL